MTIFDSKLIVTNLEVKSKEELFEVLARILLEEKRITDLDVFLEALWKRERIIPTGMGRQVAIPHGKSTSVTEPSVVFARLKRPMEYQAIDGQPIELVFMIAMPEESDRLHLEVLSQLATKLLDDEMISKFKTSEDVRQIYQLLSKEL